MGYCGICNTHYDCHYTEHEEECPGQEVYNPNPMGTKEDRFMHEKQQQGWDDEMDEHIWNEHFRYE